MQDIGVKGSERTNVFVSPDVAVVIVVVIIIFCYVLSANVVG